MSSRLSEILENHENLNELFSILKHYGVNAEMVTNALIEQLDQTTNDNNEQSENGYIRNVVEDLIQFSAKF